MLERDRCSFLETAFPLFIFCFFFLFFVVFVLVWFGLVFCTQKTWYNSSHFSMCWHLKSLCSPMLFTQICSLLSSDTKVSNIISTTLNAYFRLFCKDRSPNTSSKLTSTFEQVIWQQWLSFWYHFLIFYFTVNSWLLPYCPIFRQYSSNADINKKLSQTGNNILTP